MPATEGRPLSFPLVQLVDYCSPNGLTVQDCSLPQILEKVSLPAVVKIQALANSVDVTIWDKKAGLRRDAVRSQVIEALEAQEIKETGNAED
jgi:hypothetical protein